MRITKIKKVLIHKKAKKLKLFLNNFTSIEIKISELSFKAKFGPKWGQKVINLTPKIINFLRRKVQKLAKSKVLIFLSVFKFDPYGFWHAYCHSFGMNNFLPIENKV
jgi:hypothetical protein